MTPTPQDHAAVDELAQDSERVVISGMSGLFPESSHVKDLEKILYSKINPVTSENCRWKCNHPEVRHHTGKVAHLERFDAQFFKVHFRLSNSMDSMGRKMLEQAYQAVYDAGINPEHLSGKKVGVYIGSCVSETENTGFYDAKIRTGFGILGCSKTMFANRISYWLNAKGPSMAIDEACCSSIAALEQAYQAIARGECEAAIVGGGSVCLHPQSSIHFNRIMTLCTDGKTKSFDQNADGCAMSDAINVLFLQKAKHAKRIYAEVVHVKTEFNEILDGEIGPKYGFDRNPDHLADFLEKFYRDARVSPNSVEYVEAFGSAISEADKAELQAVEKVFCKKRDEPLLVGSVMSNIGYGEAASGISAITKVLLGYQRGELAANLHYTTPRDDIAALHEGKIQIVHEHRRFGRTYTAINGLSITGISAHVLLLGHYKPKDLSRYKSSIPHLVTISGRQDTAVKKILDDLKTRPVDPEELALFHNIHQTRISGHLGRGYTILDSNGEKVVCLSEQANYFDDAKRPLWFVYSGMGSQWAGMGAQLMRIPVFAAAIEKCRRVLEPKGLDIVHIITSPEKTMFDNILHSFVGIAAVQIGLTDILLSVGLVPDNIIGHSVGELGCAYVDGCFTAEEMILSAYCRGLVSVQTSFIKGSMAAVGIGYQQVSKLLPPEIEVACHNGPESATISGPAEAMRDFVAKLTAQNIFAKEVPCSNIAYHSRYIAEAGPALLKYLREVIKKPKQRSERWVSTSVPQDKWNEARAKLSSAEYHTNNLLSPVLFEETLKLIPDNAVLVEIAPHGLLQVILKRSLTETCRHIPLTRRGHADNAIMVLDGIGKLFMEGFDPKVHVLYEKVEFPVSTGTPMLSHLVEWAHHEEWNLPLYMTAYRKTAAARNFVISVHDDEYNYLRGHVIREKNLFPFAAALVAAWDTLAMSRNVPRKQLSVEFKDVHLFTQPPLYNYRQLRLSVALHRGSGRFEILDENHKVATGFIRSPPSETVNLFKLPFESNDQMDLLSDDVYRLLEERDYSYLGEFKSIYRANQSLTEAQIIWNGNWVTFLNGLLQLTALNEVHDSVSQPSQIRRLCIDIKRHTYDKNIDIDGKTIKVANVIKNQDIARCGGVLLQNVKYRKLQKLEVDAVTLKTLKFIPRFQAKFDVERALHVYLQIVAENINKNIINIVDLLGTQENLALFKEVKYIVEDIFGIKVKYEKMRREKILLKQKYFLNDVDLILIKNLSADDDLCQIFYRVLRRDTFVINGEEFTEDRIRPSALYRVVSSQRVSNSKLELVKWRPTETSAASTIVTVRNASDLALITATRQEIPKNQNLIILSSYPAVPGLKDLVKQWRKDIHRNQINVVMISHKDNLDQLPELDLAFNVLKNGVWGGDYYTSCNKQVVIERGVTLRTSRIGNLDALHWEEAPQPTGSDVAVTVHYAAINDADVKKAAGIYPLKQDETYQNTGFCMDFSGVTDSGERVMGIVPNGGAASSRLNVRPELLWPVPDHWSLEDAATVPTAYTHAFYCFTTEAKFIKGTRVLVHGGAGALGQASIAIALENGYEVFATVSDIKKKRFLMKIFPELKEDHIGNSRDATFGDMVLSATNGRGCNIVISCLKGDLKNTSLRSCASSGVTVDTEQILSRDLYIFGMLHLTKNRTYTPVDFTSVYSTKNTEVMKKIHMLLSDGIMRGYVRPLSRLVYSPQGVTKAFRLLAGSRHRGRVLLKLHDCVSIAQPRLYCPPDLCHVVLCDNDSLGIQLANMLIRRGATKLRLHCAKPSSYMRFKVQSWEKLCVKIEISSEDLTNNKGIIKLLNESNNLGPVDSIYITATEFSEKSRDDLNTVVANLDLCARKVCPYIRHFVVVMSDSGIGQKTCCLRNQNNLPVTVVDVSGLKIDKPGFKWWNSAVKAIELTLRSSQSNVLAYPKTSATSLIKEIAQITGLNITEVTSQNATLMDLGFDIANVLSVKSYLRDTHCIDLLEDEIIDLTVDKIHALEDIINGSKFKQVQGLSTFFSYIDSDELLATTEMVFMATLSKSSDMRDDEFDVNENYLCMMPGLEGHYSKFKFLCDRVKLPALVMQPGLDHLSETIRETAERFAKILMKKTGLRDNFYLLGYETGAIVALELASIMEEHNVTGTVYCVGGTPEEIKTVIEENLSEYKTEEVLQDAIIRHMFLLMTGNTEGLENILQTALSWQEKLEKGIRMLLGQVPHSAQYAKALMDAAYKRLGQARVYKTQPKPLRSKIVWLRASGLSNLTPMIQMQRYSQQTVSVHELEAPLAHATKDLQCSAIINKYLDPKLLEAFELKNLCETYLFNAKTFTGSDNDVLSKIV